MRKKGPWTPEEDRELVEYVKTHGEGNWNMIEISTSLRRRGKSCRLRWLNHLKPSVKKGPLSPQEESLLIRLHKMLGNRWAQIATELPGRSDNEIKNYWHTRTKKLVRSGLPIYPAEPETIVQQNNQIHQLVPRNTILSSSPNIETHFSNPNERSFPLLVPSYPNPENSKFQFSPQLSLGPFNYSSHLNSNHVFPNSSFDHYDTNLNPINGDDTNFIHGSNSYSPPLSSTLYSTSMSYLNTQSHLDLPYILQSESSNFYPNDNPELRMPIYFEPQSSFSNNGTDLSPIRSLLGNTPASCESRYGANSMNMTSQEIFMMRSSDYSPSFAYTATDYDNLPEDIVTAPQLSVSSAISLGEGQEIFMRNIDCSSRSGNTSTEKPSNVLVEELFPVDDDFIAQHGNFPIVSWL